jgi:hypothetical protein
MSQIPIGSPPHAVKVSVQSLVELPIPDAPPVWVPPTPNAIALLVVPPVANAMAAVPVLPSVDASRSVTGNVKQQQVANTSPRIVKLASRMQCLASEEHAAALLVAQ